MFKRILVALFLSLPLAAFGQHVADSEHPVLRFYGSRSNIITLTSDHNEFCVEDALYAHLDTLVPGKGWEVLGEACYEFTSDKVLLMLPYAGPSAGHLVEISDADLQALVADYNKQKLNRAT